MIKQLQTVETVEDVIAKLGGPEAVADLTKRESTSAVPMWKTRKKFPLQTFTTIQAALQARGLTAPNSLWGMP